MAWLVVARAAGLAALVLAYGLGRRLAGPLAGGVASLALALSGGWLRGMKHGYSERSTSATVISRSAFA